ncbi:CAMK family protein kinase [Histomonas meleagridis]|uniref:CAMK family protein kinase n=1 Tax=Histomonas meleagridis TaxID=135588 RepID=UPI00355A9264|nr:CAMK family protein kinase [Histomonas meleagridis]KAH0800165.1 CAMK family protein kinase [Histomonas meleagridis]
MENYKVIKDIGKGSYGSVVLANDKRDGKYVVIKTIRTKDAKTRASAENEAEYLKKLQHPNVIEYLDSFQKNDHEFCIVLEYADASDLSHYVDTNKLTEAKILQIFSQLIFGLEYIHSQNILHRDIKIANIFLFKNGFVKIGDFGISREIGKTDLAKTIIGTPYFMAPEIIKGKPYGYPADVWAAGCVLFELMTGKHAFTGKSREDLFNNIQYQSLPRKSFSKYSKQLTDILLKTLNKNPILRPTCRQILQYPIIQNALKKFQQKVSGTDSQQSTQASKQSTNSEIEQQDVPSWIRDNPNIANDLMRQSFRKINNDGLRFAEIVKSSLSKLPPQQLVPTIQMNIAARKKKLEDECKEKLGEDKFRIVYDFIRENWTKNRDKIPGLIGINYFPENEVKMIDMIMMIERFH